MQPQDYLIDGARPDAEERLTICTLGFVANSDDYWLLGDVMMRGFYVIHDDANHMIGIAPHSNSDKSALRLATQFPTDYITNFEWKLWMKILVGVGIAVLVILLILFGWFIWPKVWSWLTSTNLASKQSYTSLAKLGSSRAESNTEGDFSLIILK